MVAVKYDLAGKQFAPTNYEAFLFNDLDLGLQLSRSNLYRLEFSTIFIGYIGDDGSI